MKAPARFLIVFVVVIILGFVAYTEFALHWAYSEGERVGILQKISRKGWLCKTDEGEIALYIVGGVAPQIWSFTVRDEEVMKQLSAKLGQRIRLHYSEHRGLPSSCFGDTNYFADSVSEAK